MKYNVRTVVIKKKKREQISVGEDVEKREPSHTAGGNVGGAATLENSMVIPQKLK